MLNIIQMLEDNLLAAKPLSSREKKIIEKVYLHPSSAMCYTYDNKPVGACLKQAWLYHKNAEPSNTITSYGIFVAESGNIWEDWLIKNYREMGIYIDSNVKLVNNDLHTSCEIDILHTNPEKGTREVTECKTYTGSNYYAARELLGYKDKNPKPKDSHLLQCVKYLMVLKDYDIDTVNLVYLDRSCSSFFNNKQFKIYLIGSEIYYDTFYQGALRTIHVDSFNIESLKEKDDALLKLLDLNYVPDPDYKISYTMQDVEEKYRNDLISKTAYTKVEKGQVLPEDMSDWQCRYCKYGKNHDTGYSTCIETQNV